MINKDKLSFARWTLCSLCTMFTGYLLNPFVHAIGVLGGCVAIYYSCKIPPEDCIDFEVEPLEVMMDDVKLNDIKVDEYRHANEDVSPVVTFAFNSKKSEPEPKVELIEKSKVKLVI